MYNSVRAVSITSLRDTSHMRHQPDAFRLLCCLAGRHKEGLLDQAQLVLVLLPRPAVLCRHTDNEHPVAHCGGCHQVVGLELPVMQYTQIHTVL